MARTKQTARLSSGGKAPKIKRHLLTKSFIISRPHYRAEGDDRSEAGASDASSAAAAHAEPSAAASASASAGSPSVSSAPLLMTDQPTYDVMYLCDRRDENGFLEYRVLWKGKHGRQARTWEPADNLRADNVGFIAEMDLVDRWIAAGRPDTFDVYMAHDTFGKQLLEANEDFSCAFEALRSAAALLGDPDMFIESVYNEFVAQGQANPGLVDPEIGVTPSMLKAFVRKLSKAGSPISFKAFKTNRQRDGSRGVEGLLKLKLEDGIFIVGATNAIRLGHCFVLYSSQGQLLVFNDGEFKTLDFVEWVCDIKFVCKFERHQG